MVKSLQISSTLVSKLFLLNCYIICLSRYLRLKLNKKRHLEKQMKKWKNNIGIWMVSMAWIASMNTISLFQQIKCVGRRIKKSVFLYDMDLIGEIWCHIQFLSLAYRGGVSDLNVVPATL